MNTIVYLIRHSEKLGMQYMDRYYADEDYQITREKRILSAEGEKKAKLLSKQREFDKIDVIYSSSYVRTIQTAKYFAERLDKKIHVDRNLNERKYGNPQYAENITLKQYYDENIKNIEGESRKEVTERMYKTFMKVIGESKGKKIAIFSHGYAITFLLLKWCKLESVQENRVLKYSFKGNVIFNKRLNSPDVFKLTINDKNEVVNVENIEFDDLEFDDFNKGETCKK